MADVTSKLEKLMVMLDRGLITREEFDQQKRELLSGGGTTASTRPSTVGSYRITGEIGRGGMGIVSRARHRTAEFAERQGGDVAIKVLHAQYAERADIVERFEREAVLGIKLDHPGIVRVHELVVDGDRVALVMEVVEGRPMSEMIGTETGPIPWERAKPMVEQLLDAVRYAHGQGVVHRDLKPENVMVGPEGRLKVLDFGIAKDLSTGRTKTGTGMGTVDYMAPEQYIDAKNVDTRADIYALGMTVYEMLAGRLPWGEDASEFEILKRKESGQIPPPTEFYPDIPEEVVSVVMTMLRPAKEERYADSEGVETALKAAEAAAVLRENEARKAAERRAAEQAAQERPAASDVSVAPASRGRVAGSETALWDSMGRPALILVGIALAFKGGLALINHIEDDQSSITNAKRKGVAEGKAILKAGASTEVTVNGVSFTLVYAPAGTFERAQHTVKLTEGFYIGTTEVTQALYAAVTGKHPWRDKPNGTSWEAGECYHYGEMAQGDSQPAYCVTWTEAVKFCNKLSHLEGLKPAYITMGRTVEPVTGASGYRLPTEAEWEYAARAGERYLYAGSDRASDVGWFYHSKTGSITHPVASKAANAWGIYDMSGNVWEWTGDWKAPYPTGSVTDPQGHPAGVYRVLRGGGFMTPATDGSTAARDGAFPVGADVYRGFRVVRPE